MTLFFVISGFLISKVLIQSHEDYKNLDLIAFYFHRVARVLPLLLLTVGIGILFLTIPSQTTRMVFCFRSHEPTIGMWVAIATFTYNWFRHWYLSAGQMFGMHWDVLWSLSVEEQFYFFIHYCCGALVPHQIPFPCY